MILKSNILSFALIITTLGMMSVSCEGKHNDIDLNNLPEPINIDLRSSEKEMVSSDQSFAFKFLANVYAEESADEDKSFMISPLSLSMALAMTMNGAEGETKSAMQETLNLNGYTSDEINNYYKKLREALLATDPSTQLSIANSIWTNQNVVIKDEFVKKNREFFNSTIHSVNFSDSKTADLINSWASDNTNGLIKKVIETTKPEDLMYLLNAIYFKGIWISEFNKNNTHKKPFILEDGSTVNVDMMSQTDKFNYKYDENLQLVELPYGNGAFSMLVLLPKEEKNLLDIAGTLSNSGYWTKLKSGLQEHEVELYIPKFKTEYSKKLNNLLTNMGMGLAFTNNANFSGMSDIPAKIDFVKQDTYISVDEVGTEAAAVTTVGMVITSMPSQPQKVVFNANKPFIYVIQENSTGSILFMGIVKNFN
ncbi:MAG: serpin family protein [Fermentimonas sp.]|nr:serpin family protein [Fermentimonas sp.]